MTFLTRKHVLNVAMETIDG